VENLAVIKILEKNIQGLPRALSKTQFWGWKIGQCCLEVDNWEVFKNLEKN
jgi:hypothetical protein